MPEALYFRTYPSGKLCFIRERGQLAKKQRNLVPSLTCYNDLQTRIHFFFFFSIPPFLSRKEHFFYPQLFPFPIFAPLRFLLPRDRPLCRRIRDGTPLLRLLNKRTLLYLPVPCLPDTSCFRQLCNQARSASGFVGRGEYRMILPYTPLLVEGTRTESYVYLVRSFNPRLILKFPFTRSLDSGEQLALSLVLFTPKLNLILHDSPSRNEHGAPKILSMIYSSNLFAGWEVQSLLFSAVTR